MDNKQSFNKKNVAKRSGMNSNMKQIWCHRDL